MPPEFPLIGTSIISAAKLFNFLTMLYTNKYVSKNLMPYQNISLNIYLYLLVPKFGLV